MTQALPRLGAGIGYRRPFRAELFLAQDQVDFLEITIEHFLERTPANDRELDLLRSHFPLVPHGLDLSLGSAEGVDSAYLNRVAQVVRRVQPPWWSEHIAYTRAAGLYAGHLCPLPWSREAVEVLGRNIEAVRRVVDLPLVLENITYTVPAPGAEMDESEFLQAVVERTGCGLLLDVTNVYTNAVNHGFDAIDFLSRIPLDRVVQLHVAGGYWEDGELIDSHSRPTPPEVWQLVQWITERAPVCGVLIERDDDLPKLTELLDEVMQARQLLLNAAPVV